MPHIFLIGINAEDGSNGGGGDIGIVIGWHYEYLRGCEFLSLRQKGTQIPENTGCIVQIQEHAKQLK